MLQFFEHKDGDQECPLKESRLTDVRNTAVDDDARIEQLVLTLCLRRLYRSLRRSTPLTHA
jgi:hypothetical protein